MRIAFIHNTEIELDSRTQKEIYSLNANGHEVLFCGWNKEKNVSNEKKELDLRGTKYTFENICVKVKKRAGLKENLVPLIRYFFRLSLWLYRNRKEYTAIHACNMDTAFLALFFAKLFKKKIVYDIYDDYADSHVAGERLHKILKCIDAFVIKNVDVVIICSEKRMEQLATTDAKKIVIIHNTPDIKCVDRNLMPISKGNKTRLVYVGNLDDTRYLRELISVVKKHAEWELHIGGGGVLESEIRKEAGTSSNIFFYGRLSYEQALSLEKQCDILPALYIPELKNHKYAAPNKFYEALYLGKPVIMFKNTGVDDLVEKYQSGKVINYSEAALENAISDIANEITKWRFKEKDIKKIYSEFFSWEIMEKRLLDIYARK